MMKQQGTQPTLGTQLAAHVGPTLGRLVLARQQGQEIVVGEGSSQVRIEVVEVKHGKVRLGIVAPLDVPIVRPEMDPEAAAALPGRRRWEAKA